ncbi:universal stress protein [Geodermatophilus sp. URMC 61]|uniref:universal stress protein n=1 Tax=Geodermatophilus sp. URMC 61 TaxID=3423411 RepID=UPI00406C72C8
MAQLQLPAAEHAGRTEDPAKQQQDRVPVRSGSSPARQAEGTDQLVVGSRGPGGFSRLLIGSVSRRGVHQARCPVTVVPPRPLTTAPPSPCPLEPRARR